MGSSRNAGVVMIVVAVLMIGVAVFGMEGRQRVTFALLGVVFLGVALTFLSSGRKSRDG